MPKKGAPPVALGPAPHAALAVPVTPPSALPADVAPAAVPPPPRPLPDRPRPARGPRARIGHRVDRIVSVHGNATLSEESKDGAVVGYKITCRNRNHHDDDDPPGMICQKTLTFGEDGAISHAECIRRLKCWFILGNDAAAPTLPSMPWPEGKYRSYHVKRFGGCKLCQLASDNTDCILHGASDEVLDHMCDDIT